MIFTAIITILTILLEQVHTAPQAQAPAVPVPIAMVGPTGAGVCFKPNLKWCNALKECIPHTTACPGPQLDAHGCQIDKGFAWCSVLEKCIEPTKTYCRQTVTSVVSTPTNRKRSISK